MKIRRSNLLHARRKQLVKWLARSGLLALILFVASCRTIPIGTPEPCREQPDVAWVQYRMILMAQASGTIPKTPQFHEMVSGWDQDCAGLQAWIDQQ